MGQRRELREAMGVPETIRFGLPIMRSGGTDGDKMPANRILTIFLLFTLGLAWAGCERSDAPQPAAKETPSRVEFAGTIVAMGDSLTEGLGVAENQSYPAQLQAQLAARGYPYRVVNAGVSGETSSGALSRIEWVLTLKPDLIILETGANDGLRGLDPELTRSNIEKIVEQLQARKIPLVLVGMQMVRNLGPGYTQAFSRIYPQIAKKYGLILMPFFLDQVAGIPQLNQADTIHPTAEGYRIVVQNLLPYVIEAIQKEKTHD
jgi:acyl-CoA thioesterase I